MRLAKSLRWPDITCSPPQVKKNCGFDPRREYFALFFAKKAGSFLNKSLRSARSPSRVFCLALCCPAKAGCLFEKRGRIGEGSSARQSPLRVLCLRFAACTMSVCCLGWGWHNYDLFYNRASRAPNIGGFLLTRLLLERLLLGPFWLERRLL